MSSPQLAAALADTPSERRFYDCSCCECGERFITTRRVQRFCSKAHARKAKARRRRAHGRERIGLHEIAARDGWSCHLCGEDIDATLAVPEYGAPTLDHVIPLARGGSHDRTNLAVAHFICNSRKGDGTSTAQSQLQFV